MKKIQLLILLAAMAVAIQAQESLPYAANWNYQNKYIGDDGSVSVPDDNNAGKWNANQNYWDIGGWTSVNTEGERLFFVPLSSGNKIENTMEFGDRQQSPSQTAFLISPALYFGNQSIKTISFKCGKNKDDQKSSNLEIVYTTNFTGDAATTEWVSLKANILPQTGLKVDAMGNVIITTNITAPSIHIAIKAYKATENFGVGEKQAQIRITAFTVTEKEIKTIPYTAKWQHKEEYIGTDGIFKDQNIVTDLGKPAVDQEKYYNLGGWESIATAGNRAFYIPTTGKEGSKKEVFNAMEYYCSTATDETSYMLSPIFNFPENTEKTISLRCGKNELGITAQLELIYSTDYTGDASTATWVSLKKDLIPDDQKGTSVDGMPIISVTTNLVAPSVVIAVRAAKTEAATQIGGKLRIANFTITGATHTTDANGAMKCTGEWTAEQLAGLSLADITSLDLTAIAIPSDATLDANKNPNCLIYISQDATAPNTWKNVVKINGENGIAESEIRITDGYPFFNTQCPISGTVIYERNYPYTGSGSLCLPFPITNLPEGIKVQEFTNNTGTTVYFNDLEEGTSVQANTPYIVDITSNGTKSFTGTEIPVTVAEPAVTHGAYTFKGTFTNIPDATDLYILDPTGTGFAIGTSENTIPAFRAYITNDGSQKTPDKLTRGTGGGGTTNVSEHINNGSLLFTSENGLLHIISDKAQLVQLYNLNGQKVKDIELTDGNNTISGIAKGIYVIKNQKVVIK